MHAPGCLQYLLQKRGFAGVQLAVVLVRLAVSGEGAVRGSQADVGNTGIFGGQVFQQQPRLIFSAEADPGQRVGQHLCGQTGQTVLFALHGVEKKPAGGQQDGQHQAQDQPAVGQRQTAVDIAVIIGRPH